MWRAIVAAVALLTVLIVKGVIPWCKRHLVTHTPAGLPNLCYRSDSGNYYPLCDRGTTVMGLAERASGLVRVFRERRLSRRSMPRALRGDSLFTLIESSFYAAVEQYLNEMQMLQYDRLGEEGYGADILARAAFLLDNAEGLTQQYGDYMLALTRSAAMDTQAERERIEAAVRGMEAAVQQTQSGEMQIMQ